MFIKSIVLDGFKSYGQRTEITGFDDQFNAITGLNGSGKSNILDSICFVLGITNLSHVRAGSLQDLIYKSGQAGINKATVSIIFDNRNKSQCPPGFENFDEITVTRQIVMGGKNKYLINGMNVPNKKVQDLFCSVQLNVNNPHFLIMQGKITKVLNMKAPEILSMIEEAAGTRMYEVKRQTAQKMIEKKDAKLAEIKNIVVEEISPKLDKLREERTQYLEYQRVEREIEHMIGLIHVYQYFVMQRATVNAEKALNDSKLNTTKMEEEIEKNKATIVEIEEEIKQIENLSSTEGNAELKEAETKLKEKEKLDAKANASIKNLKETLSAAKKKEAQLEKNLKDETKALENKQNELSKVQSLFETLKENEDKDARALELAQKNLEAINAGTEVNESGEAQTLQDQLMAARAEAKKAVAESQNASMELNHCRAKLKEKQRQSASAAEYEKDKATLVKMENEIKNLENSMAKLNYSQEKFKELENKRIHWHNEVRAMRRKVDDFFSAHPFAHFQYRDPERNFNRKSVSGLVCNLFQILDNKYCYALEIAGGGKIFNVVVDSEVTGKKLISHGDLQTRTTFLPLNKIQAQAMSDHLVKIAQDLVGRDNCSLAYRLIRFEPYLKSIMAYCFGHTFICKDISYARRVTYDKRLNKGSVTLDGDSCDPGGTLSGGSRQQKQSRLMQLIEINKLVSEVEEKERGLNEIDNEMRKMIAVQDQYHSLQQKLELIQSDANLVRQRLQNTQAQRDHEEMERLEQKVIELQDKIKGCKEAEIKANTIVKELEMRVNDVKGYREKALKKAEAEVKRLKQLADKSKAEWKKREQEYESLNLEISSLKESLENTEKQLKEIRESIEGYNKQLEELVNDCQGVKEEVKNLQALVKQEKAKIAEKNKNVEKKNIQKEKLIAANNELQLEIKKLSHEVTKLEEDYKKCKKRAEELSKKVKSDNQYVKEAEKMTEKEGADLERRIKNAQERKHKLGRTVNTKAQTMFEHEEKHFNEMRKRKGIVENDKMKLINVMADLDKKKKNALKLAYEQISKDFGSIFSTLLPGANAKLVPPPGKSILEGLEVKVALGNVWKENLSELSGGQRSLAALSLILAMLLFKPAPIYILDEVDAALDLSHTQNIGNMLKSHFKKSQFIIVSLKDGMFNNANVLFRTKFIDGVSTVSRTVNRVG